jgi:hypothetical protein
VYDYSSAQQAYHKDPVFRRLIDVLYDCIDSLNLTPADVRAAAMYACIRHAQREQISIVLSREEAEKLGLKIEG